MKKTVSGIMLTLLLIGCAGFFVSSFLNIHLVCGADVVCEIDLFNQRGGIGINASSPPFETGERIILFAYVAYNQMPVPQVLVAFQVNNPDDIPILVSTAITNSSGIATITFTIAREMYPSYPSLWKTYATSSPSQETVQDIMPFYMQRAAQLITVPDDYSTIQEAINAAYDGNTVFVRNGTYSGPITIDKTLILEGENRNATVIDGGVNEPSGSIVLVTADNVKISDFTIQHCRAGGNAIYMDGYGNMTFSNNTITGCNEGIRILHSSGNTISYNIIQDCYYNTGLGFNWAYNNVVYRNILANNNVGIGGNHWNNTFFENVIRDNNAGWAKWGISDNFYNCVFFHNNIINNGVQVFNLNSSALNVWDNGYPSGGNYWSDYTSVDSNRDGIGDTPHVVDVSNQDNYPLMKPYAGSHDIGIISLSASKTVIAQGVSALISFEVINYGVDAETFSVAAYANQSNIFGLTISPVPGRSSVVFAFVWHTIAFATGNYIITAYAGQVYGETDLLDNVFAISPVKVTIAGDVNGDFFVNIADVGLITANWLKSVPSAPANADVNGDFIINIADVGPIATNWLKHA